MCTTNIVHVQVCILLIKSNDYVAIFLLYYKLCWSVICHLSLTINNNDSVQTG